MLYKLLLFALLVTVYGGLKRVDVVPPSSGAEPLSLGSRPRPRPPPSGGRGQMTGRHLGPSCPNRNPRSYEDWYKQFKRRGWDFSSDKGDIVLNECIPDCFERNNRLWTCNAYERFKLSFVECLKECMSTRGINNGFLLSDAFDAFNAE